MLNRELGITIIMVLHDINQAAQYSDCLLYTSLHKHVQIFYSLYILKSLYLSIPSLDITPLL